MENNLLDIEKIIFSIMEKYNYKHIYNEDLIKRYSQPSKMWYIKSVNNHISLNCCIKNINNDLIKTELISIPFNICKIFGINDIKLFINDLKEYLDMLDINTISSDKTYYKVNDDIICTIKNDKNVLCCELDINKLIKYMNNEVIEKSILDVFIKFTDIKSSEYSLALAQALRMSGFNVDIDYLNKDNIFAKFNIIVDCEELKNDILTIVNNNTNKKYEINKDDLIEFLDQHIEEEHYE